MQDYSKQTKNENFLEFADRLLANRQEYDLDKVELYEILYGNQVSSDHARKALTVLQMTIEEQKKSEYDNECEYNQECKEPNNTEQYKEPDTNQDTTTQINTNSKYKYTTEINSDGSQTSNKLIEMSESNAKNPEFLLKAHGFCDKTWELKSAKNNIWNTRNKDSGTLTMYSSKITVKPKVNISLKDIQEHFYNFEKSYESPQCIPTRYNTNGKMLEINIADLHVGKLAWNGETGENYDYKIAKERFMYIINDILTRTELYKFSEILFVFDNDFFHFDQLETLTTSGTKQDSDLRWQKLFKVGIEMLVEGIDLLSKYAPVRTFYIGSNHDKMTSFYAMNYLYAWYKDNNNVAVDISPKIRKYIEFGNCLIGFTHGSYEKKNAIGKLMPIEAREAWGRTLYHEVHAAHFHSEHVVKEENGIIIRYISSPVSTDNWHYEKGYVGAVKKAQSFIWDRELGLTDILMSVITD